MPVSRLFVILLLLAGCGEPSITSPSPPRVLVLTPEQYTFGGGTPMEALIEAAGGVNAAYELNDYSQIADWQIVEMAPDVILFSRTWTIAQIDAWVAAPVYADVPAIKHKRFFQVEVSLAEADIHAQFDDYVGRLHSILVK